MSESLIKRKEAAKLLSICVDTFDKNVTKFIADFGLKRVQVHKGHKGVRYLRSSVDTVIQAMADATESGELA